MLAWAAGRRVLKVEFWYVFEEVIEYLCEKEVFKKCWHGELAGQFWRSSSLHVFEHVIKYLCEKYVFKKMLARAGWLAGLAGLANFAKIL